jgi:hypothetical protein
VGIENDDLFDERVVARYILFYNNISDTVGLVGGGEGNVLGAPVFVDPGNRDYHIAASSAARDVALDIGVTTDYDQESRPQGAGFDIGADEYFEDQGTPTPTFTPGTPTPTFTPGTPTPTFTPGTPTPTSTPGTPTATFTPGTPTPTFTPGGSTSTPTPSVETPTPSPTPESEIFLPVIHK